MNRSTNEVMCPTPFCPQLLARNLDLLLDSLSLLVTHQTPYPPGQATWHEDTCDLHEFPLSQLFPTLITMGAVGAISILKAQKGPQSCALAKTGKSSWPYPVCKLPIPSPMPELTNKAWPSLMSPIYTFPNLQVQAGWHILGTSLICCVHIRSTTNYRRSHDQISYKK